MPRGKAEVTVETLRNLTKTFCEQHDRMLGELNQKDAGGDGESVKKAIRLLRTPGLNIEDDVLPYIQVAVNKLKKGKMGTKKPKPTPVPDTAGQQ